MEAPVDAGHHGDCKGGLEGLVGQLRGDHEAFVVPVISSRLLFLWKSSVSGRVFGYWGVS